MSADVLPFDGAAVSPAELQKLLMHVADAEGDSFAEIARIMGVHENTVADWCHGKRLERLSRFLRYFEARGYVVRISKRRREPLKTVGADLK